MKWTIKRLTGEDGPMRCQITHDPGGTTGPNEWLWSVTHPDNGIKMDRAKTLADAKYAVCRARVQLEEGAPGRRVGK